MSDHTPLGEGYEFDAIRALLVAYGPAARGTGDDAAVVSVPDGEKLVVSTDFSVDGIHFRRAWLDTEEIGWRATMAALSDLAAMGAQPLGILVALAIPDDVRVDLVELGSGIGAAAIASGTVIIGGDITRAPTFSLGITVLGSTSRPLTRAGARAGDALWVTGRLGGPGAAVRAWEHGAEPTALERARFANPVARLEAGRWLVEAGATAAIDISDGLIVDARHLAAASDVRLTLALEAIPCVEGITPVDAVISGEEYELLVAAPADLDAAAFRSQVGLAITRIGLVEQGPADVVVLDGGVRVEIAGGHDHFSS